MKALVRGLEPMFEWFRNLGSVASLMGNMGKIQEEMAKMQAALAQITVEGDAGAGMVKVKANGKLEVLSVRISDDAMKLQDREMLEDLVRGAINQAMVKAREAAAAESAKMGTALGLPVGFKLPGMG
jgi:DNA-binding YbaB/EbfC family protein